MNIGSVALINLSTGRSNTDCDLDARAIAQQVLEHFAPAWQRAPVPVVFYADPKTVPADAAVIAYKDSSDQPGAGGYHEETDDKPDGFVFLDSGMDPCVTASHEVLELLGNPDVNGFWDGPAPSASSAPVWSWAQEVGDPVQDGAYGISFADASGVAMTRNVSNFILPAWADPESSGASYDWMGVLSGPFQVSALGYAVVRADGPGSEQQVFGTGWSAAATAAASSKAGGQRRRDRLLGRKA